jgi:hypothetical protein
MSISTRNEVVSRGKFGAGPTLSAAISGPALAAMSLPGISGDARGRVGMNRAIRAQANGPIGTHSGTSKQAAKAGQRPERLRYAESFHGAHSILLSRFRRVGRGNGRPRISATAIMHSRLLGRNARNTISMAALQYQPFSGWVPIPDVLICGRRPCVLSPLPYTTRGLNHPAN